MKDLFWSNIDKIAAFALTVIGAMYGTWRKFNARIVKLESEDGLNKSKLKDSRHEISELKIRIGVIETEHKKFETTLQNALSRIDAKLEAINELKITVERNDATLAALRDNMKELRDDIKTLIRD